MGFLKSGQAFMAALEVRFTLNLMCPVSNAVSYTAKELGFEIKEEVLEEEDEMKTSYLGTQVLKVGTSRLEGFESLIRWMKSLKSDNND